MFRRDSGSVWGWRNGDRRHSLTEPSGLFALGARLHVHEFREVFLSVMLLSELEIIELSGSSAFHDEWICAVPKRRRVGNVIDHEGRDLLGLTSADFGHCELLVAGTLRAYTLLVLLRYLLLG